MARRRLWRNHVVSSYWRTRHPLLRFLCLHEAVTLPFVVAIFWPNLSSAIIHLHFGNCLSGTLFSSRWSAMEFRRCQPLCVHFIAREDPHSKCIKCLGFSHTRDAVYGTSKCKICEDFHLITLRSRLEDCERESSIFPRRTSSIGRPEGDGRREAVKELRRATDLALRATKHTARAVGRSMAVSVGAECHLFAIWPRSVRGRRCFWWTHPSHNLGYLGRRLAL